MMMDNTLVLLVMIATIGAGLMSGVYFAFSSFIMGAFDRLGAEAATAAMNSINEVILRSGFMIVFFGSTAIYAGLTLAALVGTGIPGRGWLLAAGLTYVIGMFVCTAVCNVPLNKRLAHATDDVAVREAVWRLYYRRWTQWNHLRTFCSLAACGIGIGWLAAAA